MTEVKNKSQKEKVAEDKQVAAVVALTLGSQPTSGEQAPWRRLSPWAKEGSVAVMEEMGAGSTWGPRCSAC